MFEFSEGSAEQGSSQPNGHVCIVFEISVGQTIGGMLDMSTQFLKAVQRKEAEDQQDMSV